LTYTFAQQIHARLHTFWAPKRRFSINRDVGAECRQGREALLELDEKGAAQGGRHGAAHLESFQPQAYLAQLLLPARLELAQIRPLLFVAFVAFAFFSQRRLKLAQPFAHLLREGGIVSQVHGARMSFLAIPQAIVRPQPPAAIAAPSPHDVALAAQRRRALRDPSAQGGSFLGTELAIFHVLRPTLWA
jgi:hypothetical protein